MVLQPVIQLAYKQYKEPGDSRRRRREGTGIYCAVLSALDVTAQEFLQLLHELALTQFIKANLSVGKSDISGVLGQ